MDNLVSIQAIDGELRKNGYDSEDSFLIIAKIYELNLKLNINTRGIFYQRQNHLYKKIVNQPRLLSIIEEYIRSDPDGEKIPFLYQKIIFFRIKKSIQENRAERRIS